MSINHCVGKRNPVHTTCTHTHTHTIRMRSCTFYCFKSCRVTAERCRRTRVNGRPYDGLELIKKYKKTEGPLFLLHVRLWNIMKYTMGWVYTLCTRFIRREVFFFFARAFSTTFEAQMSEGGWRKKKTERKSLQLQLDVPKNDSRQIRDGKYYGERGRSTFNIVGDKTTNH